MVRHTTCRREVADVEYMEIEEAKEQHVACEHKDLFNLEASFWVAESVVQVHKCKLNLRLDHVERHFTHFLKTFLN